MRAEARRLLTLRFRKLVEMRSPRGHLIGNVFETPRGVVWESIDGMTERARERGEYFSAFDEWVVSRSEDGIVKTVGPADPNSPWPLEIDPRPHDDDQLVGSCRTEGWFARPACDVLAAVADARRRRRMVTIIGKRYSRDVLLDLPRHD